MHSKRIKDVMTLRNFIRYCIYKLIDSNILIIFNISFIWFNMNVTQLKHRLHNRTKLTHKESVIDRKVFGNKRIFKTCRHTPDNLSSWKYVWIEPTSSVDRNKSTVLHGTCSPQCCMPQSTVLHGSVHSLACHSPQFITAACTIVPSVQRTFIKKANYSIIDEIGEYRWISGKYWLNWTFLASLGVVKLHLSFSSSNIWSSP